MAEEEDRVNDQKTVMIVGVCSFLGSNLANLLKKDFKVVGTYHKVKFMIPGVLTLPCDVLVKEEVQLVIFAMKPDYVIYCVGVPSLTMCAKYEKLADALNTSGLFNVTEYCQRYKAQICYLSSAYVFNGQKKSYIEMELPDAISTYGHSMAAGEFYLQKSSLNYVIFRCCNFYGRGIDRDGLTPFEKMQKKLVTNQSFIMDDYVNLGFLDVYYLALILKMCFKKGVMNRLFQVCSSDMMTHYQFAQTYANIFGESVGQIAKGKWHFPFKSRTIDSIEDEMFYKLDVSNIEGFLNIQMPSIEESLRFSFRNFHGVEHRSEKSKGEGVSFI
jgi:dTDP-4-dehydrorhamnose reductase